MRGSSPRVTGVGLDKQTGKILVLFWLIRSVVSPRLSRADTVEEHHVWQAVVRRGCVDGCDSVAGRSAGFRLFKIPRPERAVGKVRRLRASGATLVRPDQASRTRIAGATDPRISNHPRRQH